MEARAQQAPRHCSGRSAKLEPDQPGEGAPFRCHIASLDHTRGQPGVTQVTAREQRPSPRPAASHAGTPAPPHAREAACGTSRSPYRSSCGARPKSRPVPQARVHAPPCRASPCRASLCRASLCRASLCQASLCQASLLRESFPHVPLSDLVSECLHGRRSATARLGPASAHSCRAVGSGAPEPFAHAAAT